MDSKTLLNIKKEIKEINGKIIIQAGHFALVHYEDNENELIPAIYQDIENKEQKQLVKEHVYMGSFPINTFKIGLKLIKFANKYKKQANLILLVNDWQWVKSVDFGQENPYRNKFYFNPKLPICFRKELKKQNINENIITPMKQKNGTILNKYYFSEMRLRNQYSNYFKLSCPIKNQCAQEQIPLFNQIKKEDCRLYISFIPKTCKLPVEHATNLFSKENKYPKIINVFI